jgi:hypothetical protein
MHRCPTLLVHQLGYTLLLDAPRNEVDGFASGAGRTLWDAIRLTQHFSAFETGCGCLNPNDAMNPDENCRVTHF